MKQIPLNLLESFLAFAEADNMRMAAAKLNLSQPALSKQLQALQEYFPNELFTVVGKKKVLTPYGLEIRSAIQSQIRSIPASIEAINNKYKDPKEITLS
ncbi:MAG TPA: LysR family transcriptional regulator, partial [Bdellovibrio sp.]|nr:LysR family transcriptional regulator [Bdellovibrio sp.]